MRLFPLILYQLCPYIPPANENPKKGPFLILAPRLYTKVAKRCRFQYDRDCTEELLRQKTKNSKAFWTLLKGKCPVKSSSLTANDFFTYFHGISNPTDAVYIADEDVYEYVRTYDQGEIEEMYDELNIDISNEEVATAVKQLKRGKAAGTDALINELYVAGATVLVPKLTKLFNCVFKSGKFPKGWSEGLIVPIPKKGNPNNVDNYRGITLLSTMGKLFTRVLNNRLTFWSDCYGILIDIQMGFRAGFSTVDNMFVLSALIDAILRQGKKIYCAFVDFRKAFDYVNRDCLWYKLLKNGVRGEMFNMISNMYSNVKSRVKYDGSVSPSFDCYLGVRQGESLSPLLFSLFINDMESELFSKGVQGITCDDVKLCLLLYADDSVLFADSRDALQEGLDHLHDYCQRWKLTVNTDKTKVLVFARGGRLSADDHWFYGDNQLHVVTQFCYLGIVFSTRGKFTIAQQTLADQARKATFALKKQIQHFYDLKPEFMCFLFDKMITPILGYACEIWGFGAAEPIERVHLQFCKNVLKLKRCTANFFVYGELGRYPLVVKRHVQIIKYWLKIVVQHSNKLVCKAYKTMYTACEVDHSIVNWASQVRDLLNSLGYGHVWLYQGVANAKLFLNEFQQRVYDNALQNWNNSVRNSSQSLMYRNLKPTMEYSPYLKIIAQPKYRYAFTKFVTKNHKLAVVTGAWHKPRPIPFRERLCTVCRKLEDEYHVVMECSKFTRLRERYISETFWRRPSMYKFMSLISSIDPPTLQNLAIFVYKISHV